MSLTSPMRKAARLTATLREAESPALAAAVEEEAAARAATLVDAIDAYRAHPYSRDVVDPDATMALGAAALRDYGGGRRKPAINRICLYGVGNIFAHR